ncbi:benzoate 4-monooxygenase cytochrome P450 [Lasiodiplodia theobromae]|uniref:Tryprostatin B 6-hydroxylase n=1 Tax=Lasiodiplodia theobromae TaxID=45133 RepID=A0A5N5DBP2_9PEZI|nr:Benzoate 4-monooxygenase cytochrome P450 [Lasiodiplodia theobromae]KAB2574534.1 Tryprostatin B 6-hydroxylase [Lasiodiplodia theobromae]KAF4537932.1 Benzoate 4-monooxygenase cytochrome P450 [Lasiodiplodia theobromae]KAF9635550.1 benzoate 4-monooxygenase cytochrome P450 [Lasiodiplodia theobromae]
MDIFVSHRHAAWIAVSILYGIITHIRWFKRFELDRYPLQVAGVFVASSVVLVKSLQSYSASFALIATYLLGLCLSTLVHRALFQPLKRFPGPFAARLSKFWAMRQAAKTQGQWYKFNLQLHAEYGDYVRIGPRDLSITDPNAIIPILGPSAKTSKGPFYGSLEESVHTTLNKEFHRQRRRVWDNGFKAALEDFAPRVEAATDELLLVLAQHSQSGTPVMFNQMIQRYSFDIMCTLAFGDARGYLTGKTTVEDEVIFKSLHDSLDVIGLFVHAPWMIKILEVCSMIPGPMKRLNDWSARKVELRRQMKNPQPDIMGHLMAHTPDNAAGRTLLNAESRLIIGAGSDTASGALAIIFAYLAAHPAHLSRLREEVAPALATGAYTCVRPALPLLDATINECLRLHPPVTWASSRVTGPAGLHIPRDDGQGTTTTTYIPPDTIVSIPPCAVARDPRNFVDPDAFRPERWTTEPHLVRRREAFMPFLIGPYQCPGKGLAMMELRSAVARTVARFDVVWMEEESLAQWADGIKDHFTMGVPRLRLGFKERKG